MLLRRPGQGSQQLGMKRNGQLGTCLLLANMYEAITDVLTAYLYHIGAALPGIEKQRECEPSACADAVPRLEFLNLSLSPAMKTICFRMQRLHISCWVVGAHSDIHCAFHNGPQHAPEHVGGFGFLRLGRHQPHDMLASQGSRRLKPNLLPSLSSCPQNRSIRLR